MTTTPIKVSEQLIGRMTISLVEELFKLHIAHIIPGELGRSSIESSLIHVNVQIVTMGLMGVRDEVYAMVKTRSPEIYDYLVAVTPMHDRYHADELKYEVKDPINNLDAAQELLNRFRT